MFFLLKISLIGVVFFFLIVGFLGGLYGGFICLFQRDLKSLIAYSSVVHIGLVIAGLLTGRKFGFEGGVIIMVGHAFCSSCLFYFRGIFYKIVGSRSLFILKGLGNNLGSLKYI
jgi:NADH:ubiquinone oxidoreductase subunit 4 (subunit M)